MSNNDVRLRAVQQALGVTFRDPKLLQHALIHSSYLHENPGCGDGDNERLEFLGDAVGDFIATEYLYERFPNWCEGPLTDLRAELVCGEALGQLALNIGLGQYVLLGKGEELSGGRTRLALLGDAFEAFLGALYLDQGLAAARQFLLPLLDARLQSLAPDAHLRDPKSRFQEWAQSTLHETPRYVMVAEAGPDHAKLFTVQAVVQGRALGEGSGRSKQAAEQEAARAALDFVS